MLAILPACAGVSETTAGQPPLARTDLGPITTEDLRFQIEHGLGLPGDEFGTETSNRHVRNYLLPQAARFQIALHELEARGWDEDIELSARIEGVWEQQILLHSQPRLLPAPPPPTAEEIAARIAEHPEDFSLPDLVTWRHMIFEISAQASSGEREAALSRALEALEALSDGEPFEGVAQRFATSSASKTPGAILGPMPITDSLIPQLADALRSLPPHEVSQPIDTPAGLVLAEVISRELGRQLPLARLESRARQYLLAERAESQRETLLAQLREERPVEVPANLRIDMPDDTPAVIIGEETVTLSDLRRRSLATPDPESALANLMTASGREELANHLLLVAEAQRRGLLTEAQWEFLDRTVRSHRVEYALAKLRAEREPTPTEDEIRALYESQREKYRTETVTFEVLRLSTQTLGAMASSEAGLHLLREAQGVRSRLAAGESAEQLFHALHIEGNLDSLVRRDGMPIGSLPASIADTLAALQPGEVSEARVTDLGVTLVHLLDRRTEIPGLGWCRGWVISDWRRENAPDYRFSQDILDAHHFEILIDPSRLSQNASGEIIVLPAESTQP